MLNAANEVAVEAFLDDRIGFMDIPRVVAGALEAVPAGPADTLDGVVEADAARPRGRRRGDRGGARMMGGGIVVNLLLFAVILMGLVLVHEAGHMVVAKWCGMKVERFSIFFGRPIASFTRGETEYAIGWLPAGRLREDRGMTVGEEMDPRGRATAPTPRPPPGSASRPSRRGRRSTSCWRS